MRKKTAPRHSSRRKVQRANQSTGLIAKTLKSRQSAGTKSALDNHSHRTPELARERIKQERAKRAHHSSFVGLNDPLKVKPVLRST